MLVPSSSAKAMPANAAARGVVSAFLASGTVSRGGVLLS